MSSVFISDGILCMVCLSGFYKFINMPEMTQRLAAVAFLLLGLASLLGTLRYLFGLDGHWAVWHNLMSRAFGVAGLYLMCAVWLDYAGLLRIKAPWAWLHLFDAALLFGIAYWLKNMEGFQLIIGVVANLCAITCAVIMFTKNRSSEAMVLFVASVLFVVNGLVIGGSEQPVIGPILRIDVFHIIFAAWVIMVGRILLAPRLPAITRPLP